MKLNAFISIQLIAMTGFINPAMANESVDYTTPYINPQRDCLTEGMNNPEGKEYRYLFSRDCRVVHVLPPAVMNQSIKSQGSNLQACEGLYKQRNSIIATETRISNGDLQLTQYELDLEKATTKKEEDRLSKRMKDLQERLSGYRSQLKEAKAAYEWYYTAPGAKFSILMNSEVEQSDLNQLRGLNLSNLNRKKTIIEHTTRPDGTTETKQTEVIEQSSLRAAQIGMSLYSFAYKVPKDAIANGGVISTNIPSLQYLGQKDSSNEGVIHVKAKGTVSGEVVLSLAAVCDNVKTDDQGKLVLDSETDPFFTVNRTFEVQQMFSRGYEAKLNVNKVVNQITSFTTRHTDQGFQKSTVFAPVITANVDEIVSFNWTTEYDDGKPESSEQILAIKQSVAAKLVDDYMEKLEEAGAIIKKADRSSEPVNGGFINETRTRHACWTERRGGLAGFAGFRRPVCGDIPYQVTVWKDGITEEEIRRSLTLHGETIDRMTINTTTPFYFTTAFVKNSSER